MNKKIQYIILNLFRSIIKFSCFLGIFHTVNTLFKQFTEKFNEENRDGCTVDKCHPNDLGFYRMAQAVYPVLKKYLAKA